MGVAVPADVSLLMDVGTPGIKYVKRARANNSARRIALRRENKYSPIASSRSRGIHVASERGARKSQRGARDEHAHPRNCDYPLVVQK